MTDGFVYNEYKNFAEQINSEKVKANIHRKDLSDFMNTLFEWVIYCIIVLNDCITYGDLIRVCTKRYPLIVEYTESHSDICKDEIKEYCDDPIPSLCSMSLHLNLTQEERMELLDSYAFYTEGLSIEEILKRGHLRITWNDIGEKVVIAWGVRHNDPWDEVTYDEFCTSQEKQMYAIGHAIILSVNE